MQLFSSNATIFKKKIWPGKVEKITLESSILFSFCWTIVIKTVWSTLHVYLCPAYKIQNATTDP
jgi:hypothetical protein